jgi:hypothetical protein
MVLFHHVAQLLLLVCWGSWGIKVILMLHFLNCILLFISVLDVLFFFDLMAVFILYFFLLQTVKVYVLT